MAGTILQRILSRTKLVATEPTSVKVEFKDMDRKTSISFEEPTVVRKQSPDRRPMSNLRKHSYASVREEADFPQSFRTRRKASNESDLPQDFLPRRLESEIALDEQAIEDDSDVSPASYDSVDDYEDEKETYRATGFEDLPDEILDQIFDDLQIDVSADSYLRPHADLFSCLLVSKSLHNAALRMLYQNVLIYRSKTFHKLVKSLEEDPALGRLIQSLDFSHYSTMGYGRSRGQTNVTPYLTKENLKTVISSTIGLKAFLVHEHLDDELDIGVLTALLNISSLRSVDLTCCTSETFVSAFSSLWLESKASQYGQLQRLCLHECTTLKPAVFESMLSRFTRLTHLDLAHTRVNDTALLSIPPTARITHLNLERCTQVTGSAVVHFLTQHPAARNLVWLNLNADASRYRLLSEEDLDELLPALPSTLRSLNLGGARIISRHVPALRQLATHVEELGLKGANLGLTQDINRILSLPSDKTTKLDRPEMKSTVRYLDLTDVSSVTQMSLSYAPISLKDSASLPLEVIELGGTVLSEIIKRNKNIKNPDWTVKELGRRGWYVRSSDQKSTDDGSRAWKMGARWWGMRKIPMIEQEVGGMYGYFMFKRN